MIGRPKKDIVDRFGVIEDDTNMLVEKLKQDNIDDESKKLILRAKKKNQKEYKSAIGNTIKNLLLAEDENGVTTIEEVAAQVIIRAKNNGNVKDLTELAKLTGEFNETIDINVGVTLKQVVEDVKDESEF